jgi:hypothetical protein
LFDSRGLAALQKWLAPHKAVRQKNSEDEGVPVMHSMSGVAGRFFLRLKKKGG